MGLVLIVDGCTEMAQSACDVLNASGFQALAATGVADAFSKCRERNFDLIVCDYYLKDGNGQDLLSMLDGLKKKPAFVMSSGCGNEKIAAAAAFGGAVKYVIRDSGYLQALPSIVNDCLNNLALDSAEREKEETSFRLEAQSQLSGWLAHNFKNILAASLGFINLIDLNDQNQSRQKQLEYLEESRQSQLKAIEILEQLIRMTQLQTGFAEPVLIPQLVDDVWAELQQKVLRHAQHKFPETFEKKREKVSGTVFHNATQSLGSKEIVKADLRFILESLLQNALEAVLETHEPRIAVHGKMLAGLPENFIALEITDNGRGMDEHVLKHALDPLFSTKGEVGVGLSLTLVSSFLQRQNGSLSMESKLMEGTTVIVKLPFNKQ